MAPPPKSPKPSVSPLALLRAQLKRRRLDGFVVPRSDEFQGEYVPPSAERLAWLTGFTGSAGAAVVLGHRAAVFVDGRYTLQAAAEVDAGQFETCHLIERPPHRWIAETLPAGARLGYDPWLHTPDGVARLQQACLEAKAKLVACSSNPLDAVWRDRPAPPVAPVTVHPNDYAGLSGDDKRAAVAAELGRLKLDAALITAPDSVAWLLNIRGGDVPYAPIPLCYALIHADARVDWFIDERKLSAPVLRHVGEAVHPRPLESLAATLAGLGGRTVRLDPAVAPAALLDGLSKAGARIDRGLDPCVVPKACKNAVELAGARAAHVRDGLALVRFFAWLSAHAPSGTVTELAAADQLESFRRLDSRYQQPSFPTISGAGPNGAIVHYRSTAKTNRSLVPGELYLVDSGGQYLDATTDVTRTLAVGTAGSQQRRHFTLVLKGHIALATARFPLGTTGSQLDALARGPLWADGLDYDHGTGHGVGSYLNVHEGPQRISKQGNSQPLLPGMIVSNEPGYYLAGAYGIRIENLVAVRASVPDAERSPLEFETLTMAPIDRTLVDPALLDARETAWLDAYHARVRETLTPLLSASDAAWLADATRPLS